MLYLIDCVWTRVTPATHIPRNAGGDAGIIEEALRPDQVKTAPIRTNCRRHTLQTIKLLEIGKPYTIAVQSSK